MTPTDAAAYVSLGLEPGAPWSAVHEAWRKLVKLHHPDWNPASDCRRLQEVNAAYAHLRAYDRRSGRIVVRRPSLGIPRSITWERAFNIASWTEWVPGAYEAASVGGGGDRRGSIRCRIGGRRVVAVVVLNGMTPFRNISARILELRIDAQIIEFDVPPKVWLMLTDAVAEMGVSGVPESLEPLLETALTNLLQEATGYELAA